MKKPQAIRATLGQFCRSFDESENRDSDEKIIIFRWGPFLLVAPGERRAWS